MTKKRVSVRFGDRMIMLLSELSELSGANISTLIRGLVERSIDDLLDEDGRWKHEKAKERKP